MFDRNVRAGSAGVLAGALALGLLAAAAPAGAQVPTPWSFAGADISDTHAMLSPPGQNGASRLHAGTASKLAIKWSFKSQGDISATPTVEQGGLYVPDWAGMIYKLNPATGAVIWSHPVSDYTDLSGSTSRTSPAIGATVVVIGDHQMHPNAPNPGARVIAINKTTGALAWVTIIDPGPYSAVDSSPVIYGNNVYVGVTGWDEGLAANNVNFVPSTRNSVVAINIDTGQIVWKFFTVPPGYAGAAVWGSNPVVLPQKKLLIVGTGNNYAIPLAATKCLRTAGSTVAAQLACLDPTDYDDAILALNLTTGELEWSRRFQGADTWTVACLTGIGTCPVPEGDDVDFASGPNLTWLPNSAGRPDDRGGVSEGYFLGAGQKSGIYWALNPINGGLFWSTLVGHGGIQWGSAINRDTDSSVFVSVENLHHLQNTVVSSSGKTTTSTGGVWGALNLMTGKMLWQIPAVGQDLVTPTLAASAGGPNSFSNGLVFTGSSSGIMVALDAISGFQYWSFNSGGTVESAPAIFNDVVYWGTGYGHGGGVSKPMLYAFAVPVS